jgi:hypothetical protein
MQIRMRACLVVLLLFAMNFSRGSGSPTSPVQMVPVPHDKLCITEGALQELKDSRLEVKVPKMRAVVAAVTPQLAEARLTYLGPTHGQARLSSGEKRRQFALKLRAQDGCNLVYAVWRIKPESALVVSVKSNPDQHASSECGNHGYRNINPTRSSAVPKLKPGDSHSLRAEMNGSEMRVSVDGVVVWEGDLGPEALAFDGPVGVRTDNGRFEFQFLTGELGAPRACREGEKEDE